jgi:hypothetical protein
MNDVEKCVKMLMSLTVKERAKVMSIMDLMGVYECPQIQKTLDELAGMAFPEPGTAYDLVKKCLLGEATVPQEVEKDTSKPFAREPFRHTEAVHFFDIHGNKIVGNVVLQDGYNVRIALAGGNAVRVVDVTEVRRGW